MNIFFEEWNYKTNGESPAFTVHTLLPRPLYSPIPPRCPSILAGICSSSIAGYGVFFPVAEWEKFSSTAGALLVGAGREAKGLNEGCPHCPFSISCR